MYYNMKSSKNLWIIPGLFLVFGLIGCPPPNGNENENTPVTDAQAPVLVNGGVPTCDLDTVYTDDQFTLTVTASVSDGGTLSYRWYEVIGYGSSNEVNTEIDGETGPSCVLSVSEGSGAVGTHWYFVEVTNVLGTSRTSAYSEYATVIINSRTAAPPPNITKQPASTPYTWSAGMTIIPLSVAAAPSSGTGNISYQWYSCDNALKDNPFLISGATDDTYTPTLPTTFTVLSTSFYYYVEVTNTDTTATALDKKTTILSNVATVTVNAVAQAGTPSITTQPASRTYTVGETPVVALTVAAASPDGGTLTYQWYSTTAASGGTPTLLTGATNASYTPAISTAAENEFYFYVVVTNTNTYAISQSATITSSVATITVTAVINDGANAIATIDTSIRYNYVRGMGAMDTPNDQNFPAIPEADFNKAYNSDSTGLGFNMLRIYIPPANTNIRTTMSSYTGTSGARPRYYAQIKKVNQEGGYVFASPWTPPAAWKTNNSVNGAGNDNKAGAMLKTANWTDYANYLKTFCDIMNENGAPIYAITIQNEPDVSPSDYPACWWTGEDMRDFYKQVGHFTTGTTGYGGGQLQPYVRTVSGEARLLPVMHDPAMDDPVSRNAIDVLARHVYSFTYASEPTWTPTPPSPQVIYEKGKQYGKEMWMTEHCVNSDHIMELKGTNHADTATWKHVWIFMNDVDLVYRLCQMSAYFNYPLKRFYSIIGDDTRYGSPGNGVILPRGYAASHYAKYAKETWSVDVTVSGTTANGTAIVDGTNVNNTVFSNVSTAVRITAYETEDHNSIRVIMWTPTDTSGNNGINMGKVRIQLPDGFVATSATGIRSTGTQASGETNTIGKPAAATVTLAPNGRTATVDLPASNIVSIKFTR